jgi:LemA protein
MLEMKRWVGCGLLSVTLAVVTIAAIAWGLISYHVLVGETIEVEARWSRIENVYQRRRALAARLAESTRGELGDGEIERSLAESSDLASQIILSPEILSHPQRLEELMRIDAAVHAAGTAVLEFLERGHELHRAVELARELQASQGSLAAEFERFNREAAAYNRRIARFPLSAFARVYGFRPMPMLGVSSPAPPATPRVDDESVAE